MKRTIRVRIAGRNPELSGFLRFLGFLILLFLMLSRLGTAFPAEATTSSPSAYTYEDWKHSLDRVAENLDKDGFHYSVNGGKGTYRKSKEKRRVTNCAIYVSWALQDAGIIKKGQVFWIDKGGAIRGKRKTCITKNSKLKVLHPHKKAKHAGLKKGDICGWDSHIHTAVYAGRDAKGRTLWYSAGRDGGVKKNGKWYFKAGKTKAKVRAARYDGKIATVIRIRNLKAAPAKSSKKKPKKAKAQSKPAGAAKADEEILNHPDETSGMEFEEIIPEYEEEVSEPEDGEVAEPTDSPDAPDPNPEEPSENVISGGETSEEPRDFETEENEPEDAEDATVDDSANDTILDLDKNEVISVKDGTRKKIQDGYGESRDSEDRDTKVRDTKDRETKDRDTKGRDTKSRKTKGETNNVRRIDTPETGDDGFVVAMVLLILSCSGLLVMAHRRNPES